MPFTFWLRSPKLESRSTRARHTRRRPPRKRAAAPKLSLALLEDRTVPSSVTVLASHLHTTGGLPEQVRVAETGTLAKGNDFTVDIAPGAYHLTDYDGGGT